MKKRIVFVRNEKRKSRGVRPRCEKIRARDGATCRKPEGHPGNCEWSVAKNKNRQAREAAPAPPKKHRHVSRETRLSCLEMIEDPQYRRKLLKDLRERKLRPAVECLLWYYAKGKPKEMVEHSGSVTLQEELSGLSNEELRKRAEGIVQMLKSGDTQPLTQDSPTPSRLKH
jgi:hypothetical protein